MKNCIQKLLIVLTLFCGFRQAVAQGSAFTYQGQLNNNGSPANGIYDLTFTLYTNFTGGATTAGPVTNLAIGVTNGLFTATIDFGEDAFTGQTNWLEIGVTTNGGNNYTTLSPRQQITPTPYAIYAPNAGQAATAGTANSVAASNVTGSLGLAQLPGAVLTNGQTDVNLTGTFTGSAAGLGGQFSTVSSSSVDILGQTAVNSNQLQDSFFVGFNSSAPSIIASVPTNVIEPIQFQSIDFDPATSNFWLTQNGNKVVVVSYSFITNGPFTVLASNSFSVDLPSFVGTSGKLVGNYFGYLENYGTTWVAGQVSVVTGCDLILLNTNLSGPNSLSINRIVNLALPTIGTNTYSNCFNAECWVSNYPGYADTGGVLLVGFQFGGAGMPTNGQPGQLPFWDTIGIYPVSTNSTWPFVGFVNVDRYQIQNCCLLAYNYSAGVIYEEGGDYLTSTSSNLSTGPGGADGCSIFQVSLTGHTSRILSGISPQSQDGCMIPPLGEFSLGLSAPYNNTVPVLDLSGSNTAIAVQDGVILLGGVYSPISDIVVDPEAGNVGLGQGTLAFTTTGYHNTAVGDGAAESMTSGGDNVAFGLNALINNTSGDNNTAVGTQALQENVAGNYNVAIGQYSGAEITGSYNIDIGANQPGTSSDNGITRIGTPGLQTAAYIAGQIIGDGSGLTNLPPDGEAQAAIKEANRKLGVEIKNLKQQNEALARRLNAMDTRVKELEKKK